VVRGFAREDLFTCVHEQFMTDTAAMADIVLPATMFLEHDDLYTGGGHQHLLFGPKLVEPPGECRTNHEVICALAERLGAEHPGFAMTPRDLIDWTLRQSGWGTIDAIARDKWVVCQPDFDAAHYTAGFAYADGKFRLKPDWPEVPKVNAGPMGPWQDMPSFPDYWPAIEEATPQLPFRLATSPARNFLNSSFAETPTSRRNEGRPEVMIHPQDAREAGIGDGDIVELWNARGSVRLHARLFDGLRRGVLISEGLFPNGAFLDGRGINTLTGADQVAPFGGAAFHDNAVGLRKFVSAN
jgi:anaerobic selenocysteine-containing dehydrogenase